MWDKSGFDEQAHQIYRTTMYTDKCVYRKKNSNENYEDRIAYFDIHLILSCKRANLLWRPMKNIKKKILLQIFIWLWQNRRDDLAFSIFPLLNMLQIIIKFNFETKDQSNKRDVNFCRIVQSFNVFEKYFGSNAGQTMKPEYTFVATYICMYVRTVYPFKVKS